MTRRATSLSTWFVALGVAAQPVEGIVHRGLQPLAEHALGLLDHHSARERLGELVGKDTGILEGAVLEHADGGDVGEGLGNSEVLGAEVGRRGREQHERPDDVAAQAHRHDVHRAVPSFAAASPKADDGRLRGRRPSAEARCGSSRSRPLGGLEFEQLQERGFLPGRRDQVQRDATVAQHDAGGIDGQQGDAPRGQGGEHVDDVELDDEVVGQLDERPREELFPFHVTSATNGAPSVAL